MNPIIGIILDQERPGGYSKFPWYALRENYFSSLQAKGAVCIAFPYASEAINSYLKIMDGLVIAGGSFDIPPSLYGDAKTHQKVTLKEERTQFEWALTQQALKENIPVLGICGGHQLLNVILGGSLIQHIPDEIDTDILHEQPTPRNEAYHSVTIIEKSLLHQIVGTSHMVVNSAHHQAIKKLGKDLIINAVAPDGVVEGIESTQHKFCLGLQWHPEFLIDKGDHKVLEAFVQVCKV